LAPVSLVGRLLFEPREFYKWLTKPQGGGGDQLFSCIEPSLQELGPNRIEIALMLPEGYPLAPEFFLVTKGTFTQLPKALGLPPARVNMRLEEHGAIYEVALPEGGGRFAKLRRKLTQPFLAGAVAEELSETHAQLVRRYDDLEKTRALVARQATQLRTAHTISQVVHGDLDLERVAEAVARALVEVAGFAAAEVTVTGRDGDRDVPLIRAVGDRTVEGEPLQTALVSRARRLGEARLWMRPEADPAERRELLEYVVPTISMAIDDALTFAEVEDYRANLALKVDERTRELAVARDELQSTVHRLEDAQTARDRIFANINHELRTPLANIALAIDRIRRRHGEALSESSGSLDGIEFNVRQLLHLMDGLLLLAAGREGRLELRKGTVDVAALCRQVVASWESLAEEAQVELVPRLPDELHAVVDPESLARATSNLLSNALKYTDVGGKIEVTLTSEGDRIAIEVRDNGIGMAPDIRERVFERFVQGPAPLREAPRGSGIGLAIVDEIVRAHNGDIQLESALGEGASFTLRLPRGEPERGTSSGPSITSLPPPVTTRVTRGIEDESLILNPGDSAATTILIAEDDPDLRRAVAELLSESHRVIAAADGAQALELAREHHPDLLLTDISMPRMDGHELARAFRALPGQRLAPIVMLTAHGQPADRDAGFEAGVIDYLLKPFDPNDLRQRVTAQLRQRELAVRLSESERLASLAILSAGLAHEFRNPANGIANAIDALTTLLSDELTRTGPAAELLDVIQTSADQLRSLCKQLLGFAGPDRLETHPQSVAALVERALLLSRSALEGRELRTRLDYEGDVDCAGPFVVQVLVNLFDNAAHAAGPDGWVGISTFASDHGIHFQVRDSGPGVPDALRDKVFQPFFTTKAPGVGTGLGLPVARRIIEQHGGRLRIVTLPGGSAFEIVLPRREHAAAE
jgi:signal transduction histidine kinase